MKTYPRKYSFHETKNIISGEGDALLINDPAFAELAEMVREQGTNRSKFIVAKLINTHGLMLVLRIHQAK